MPLESTFSYSNAPQAIIPKKKYRSEEDGAFTLMSDPRVVRGSVVRTAGGTTIPGKKKSDTNQQDAKAAPKRSLRPTYEYKVADLVKPEIDLSQYLVEREDTGLKKPPKEVETQTDTFKDRPDTPEYVPRKTGVDVETQVEDVSELFNFDEEVEPMLAVICSKTLEQALYELECEGELINLQEECDRFDEIRVAEQQWATTKEQETIAESYTKDLALKGLKNEMASQRQVREKVAGLEAMRQMLPAMLENISDELYASGDWKDPERQDIDTVYLPQIYDSVQQNLSGFKNAQALLDEILLLAVEGKEVACMCGQQHGHKSKVVLKLMATGEMAGVAGAETVTLGFVSIDDNDTIELINKKVNAKIAEEGLELPTNLNIHGFIAQSLGHTSPDDLGDNEVLDQSKLPSLMNIILPDK